MTDMPRLILSLFPGIGLLDMAFEEAGFCVVRGPDVLWGGDIRKFHPPAGRFDGVIGGPPCQAFSRLAHMVRHNGYEPKFGNLIPEFERCVFEAQPPWFLMENVPDAPVPAVSGYDVYAFILNNRQCIDETGEPSPVNRVRRWSWGWRGANRPPLMIDVALWENPRFEYATCGGSRVEVPIKLGGSSKLKPALRKSQQLNSAVGSDIKSKAWFRNACRKQGLPDTFDLPGFTAEAKCKAIGNGVPLPMGRAVAKAVAEAVAAKTLDT